MNNRFVKFASAIALSAILFTACAKAPKDALVKIGDKYITEEQVSCCNRSTKHSAKEAR